MSRGTDVDHSPACHERIDLLGRPLTLEDAEPARAPLALEIDVRAEFEQEIDHRQVLPGHVHGTTTEITSRFVHRVANFGVFRQKLARARNVALPDRCEKRLLRRSRQRLDLALQVGPALEAVAASDDELRVGQLHRVRLRWFRMQRADSREGFSVARPGVAKQILRTLLLHLEVRFGWERFDENGRTFFGRHDDTSRSGMRPLSAKTGRRFVWHVRLCERRQVGASLPADGARPARAE